MDIVSERSYPTPVSNSTLLPLLLLSLAKQNYTPSSSTCVKNEYDYIIVGGGSAGSVVASRLSEEPCVSVLLLEAGHIPPRLTEVPAFGPYFLGTDVDWKYMIAPQKHAADASMNRQVNYPLGKMLGGSGNHNFMAYIRGNRNNYDIWAAQGAVGWSYRDVLPYFWKLEDFRVPSYLYNGYHAEGGPITVELPNYDPELKRALYTAISRLGYRFIDINAERQTGFFDTYMNIRDGQRCSPVKGHLVPAAERKNLDILLNAMVTKIAIKDNEVKGVQYYHEGQYRFVRAKREVILSAGAVNTPKILLLSGVGPREELQKLDIPVFADLPVGKNLHDHCGAIYYFTLDPRFPSRDEELADPVNILKYIHNRSGPLVSGGYSYTGFLKGLSLDPPIDFPNLALYIGPIFPNPLEGINARPDVRKRFVEPNQNKTLIQCFGTNLQPRSRGTITLVSSNPFEPPSLDPNYYADSRDLEDVVDGLKICRELVNTPPLKWLGARPLETPLPGCEMYALYDDNYLRCYARALLNPFMHAVGTCKMGHPEDPTTVVDPELRVKNIKRLRVVDASIMPVIPSGNVNIPTVMVAEKASDIIKSSIICGKKNCFPLHQ